MQPVAQLCEEFPAYKPCVDKRRNYMLDMDAYERKLEHTKAHTKDPGQIPHRVEQHSRASRRFAQFNDKLVDDLTLLDNNRFELAGFLIENFVETQEFEVNRKRDVTSPCRKGKLLAARQLMRADRDDDACDAKKKAWCRQGVRRGRDERKVSGSAGPGRGGEAL